MDATLSAATHVLKQLTAYSPETNCTEFRIGVRCVPYLADHGFQGMVVLPGSFYVEIAMCMERELFDRVPRCLRNITFDSPITLSTDDVIIRVEVRDLGEECFEYLFFEAGVDGGNGRVASGQHAARLEVALRPSTRLAVEWDAPSVEAFQRRSECVIGAQAFYAKLRENGNEYGRSFQNVSSIWRTGDETLGQLVVANQEVERHCLHPTVLDAFVQLLSPVAMDKGKTFILRSIGRIELVDTDFPDTLWAHATVLSEGKGDASACLGNVRVFSRPGKPLLELADVGFTLADRVSADEPAARLVVAANFTAEPLEESLQFWADYFDAPLDVEFAPYGQVFQQLLDPDSAFQRNRDGANVILLALDEWAAHDRSAPIELDVGRARSRLGAHARCTLPNGLEIAHLNRYETDYLYSEIFEDQVYLRHGIHLRDGATVVDIGANIGLFSLFVMTRCANPTIYAFEPAPRLHELLKANCEAYGANGATLDFGVSDKPGTATFTFYENSSVFSGFHADEHEDGAAIRAVVRNILCAESVGDDSVDQYVDELTAERLRCISCECRLTSLSDFIRENAIEKIDLLKIDAEKCEQDIVRGIGDEDWPKIGQIVIEVHDRTGDAVARIRDLLVAKGYRCAVEQESLLAHAGFFNLYATRGSDGAEAGDCAARQGSGRAQRVRRGLDRNIRDLAAAVPTFMDRSAVPLVLCFTPRSPAARADPELMSALDETEAVLAMEASRIPNVRIIRSATPLQRYPLSDYYDAHAHQAGHVPYTQECYAAIGTELARTLFHSKASPYKVIALDCDNTLWKGVCGEDGPLGVEVAPPYRALQEFMIERMHAGMLLCLCSKNNEQDALDVFDRHPGMLLKREHLVACRLNWRSKSENLQSLARELELGLESFIFIDDSPVECADVRINCPAVLALQLPRDAAAFPAFLEHVWAFDRAGATDEDRTRTRMYHESARRAQHRERSFSLKDFVGGLELRVEIGEANEGQLARLSQLTLRTNQFNLTTLRRSEGEIGDFLGRDGAHCAAVRVTDRFGDYGVVGVVMYEATGDRYKVDTLLLSCRALGRGVEHAVVSWLGKRAAGEGKGLVELRFVPSERNRPARDFLESLRDRIGNGDDGSWIFPAQRLARVEYDPDAETPAVQESPTVESPSRVSGPGPAPDIAGRARRLQRIAEDLHDVECLAKAIEEIRLGEQPSPAAENAPGAEPLETALVGIWRKVLGRPHIGVHDNFLDAGGTSLKAVQVIARVKKDLKRSLSIVSIFESPTVALLAARLNGGPAPNDAQAASAVAALRGQGRRYSTQRRYASGMTAPEAHFVRFPPRGRSAPFGRPDGD